MKKQSFDKEKMTEREYAKAYNILREIKNGDLDKTVYERLEPETRNFLIFLLQLEISCAIHAVETLDEYRAYRI